MGFQFPDSSGISGNNGGDNNSLSSLESIPDSWPLIAGLVCGIIANFVIRGFRPAGLPPPPPSPASANSMRENGIQRSFASSFGKEHKMSLVIRSDLGMKKGKVAAQCAHAAVGAYKKALVQAPEAVKTWELLGQTKVTLKIEGEEGLYSLKEKAQKMGLVAIVIHDAGRTQIEAGSATVLSVGPGPIDLVDSVTGHLKLY